MLRYVMHVKILILLGYKYLLNEYLVIYLLSRNNLDETNLQSIHQKSWNLEMWPIEQEKEETSN